MVLTQRKLSICTWIFTTLFGVMLLSFAPAQAQFFGAPPPGGCDGFNPDDPYGLDCGTYSGLSPRDPRLIVARVINVSLSVLGILSVAIIVFAGFKWMTAGGNEEQAKSARNILVAAVIGLIIILSAFSLSQFILSKINEATR